MYREVSFGMALVPPLLRSYRDRKVGPGVRLASPWSLKDAGALLIRKIRTTIINTKKKKQLGSTTTTIPA